MSEQAWDKLLWVGVAIVFVSPVVMVALMILALVGIIR